MSGIDSTRILQLALLSDRGAGYQVLVVRDRGPRGNMPMTPLEEDSYLLFRRPGTYCSAYEDALLRLTADAFGEVVVDKTAAIYYYRAGEFKSYVISG